MANMARTLSGSTRRQIDRGLLMRVVTAQVILNKRHLWGRHLIAISNNRTF
jgi:hypothetical protein